MTIVDDGGDGDFINEDGDAAIVDSAEVVVILPRMIVESTAPVVTPPRLNKESIHPPSYF